MMAVKRKVKVKPKSVGTSNRRGLLLWLSLGLIAATLLIYAQVWRYPFINFDDDDYVYANPVVTAGLTGNGVWWALTTNHQGNWHPLTWLSHMVDAQLYGMNAGGHHVTNVFLHIINSLMLFWLLHRMTQEPGRSAFVAMIFAIHPLHVESVAWVAERKDVLSMFFFMLTLCAYVAYVRQPRLGMYALVFLFYAMGLMAKPMLVTLPFVLLLLDVWPLRRLTMEARALPWRRLGQLIPEKIPLLVLTVASSVITYVVQQQGNAVSALDALPMKVRTANVLISYVEYMAKIFWPSRLAVLYPYSSARSVSWFVALLLLLVLCFAAIAAARRYPYIPVGWFWFLGTLVPVIGLIQVGVQSMADRYTYLPLVGISMIVAWGVPDLLRPLRLHKPILAAASGVVIVSCMIVAWYQVQYWKSTLALWGRALEVTADNFTAHHAIASELGTLGKNAEAIAHLNEALRIKPNYPEAHYNIGLELVALNKWDEAGTHFSEAIRLDPSFASAHNNLANILVAQGRLTEAADEYSEALRLSPNYVDAHFNLAVVFLKQGKVDEAKRELLEVLKINPQHPNAQKTLLDVIGQDNPSRVTTP
jgi:protein O-mannosyl-transferase